MGAPETNALRTTELDASELFPVAVGDVVGEAYKVTQVLRVGTIAIVAEATSTKDGRVVDLEVMRDARRTPERVERFLATARGVLGMKSAHVVRPADMGTLPSGSPWAAFERPEGQDLAYLLRRDGVLSPIVAVDYMLQVCDAIAEAHRLGIVHADLRPANLFLTHTAEGAPVVKVRGLGTSALAETGDGPEVLRYRAPEQIVAPADGQPVSRAVDVWALGAMMFELVTGHSPFDGVTEEDVRANVLERPLPSLEASVASAPPNLGAAIGRCLERDPKRRWVAAGAFALALETEIKPGLTASVRVAPESVKDLSLGLAASVSAVKSSPPIAPARLAPIPGLSVPPPPTRDAAPIPPVRRRKRRGPLLLAVVLAVGIAGVFVIADRLRPRPRALASAGVSASTSASSPASASASSSTSSSASASGEPPDAGATPSAAAAEPSAAPSAKPRPRGRPRRH